MVEIPIKIYVQKLGQRAREAARPLSLLSGEERSRALVAAADRLRAETETILEANQQDVDAIPKDLDTRSYRLTLDRIRISEAQISKMIEAIHEIAETPDPLGEMTALWSTTEGLQVSRKRAPLGVIGIISDMGPLTVVESISLCLRTGNVCIFRGGTDWFHTNLAVAQLIQDAAQNTGIPSGAVSILDRPDREGALELIRSTKYLDAVIPKGKASLRKAVMEHARIPILGFDGGTCHIYIDADVELPLAQNVIVNSKIQDPTASNSADTLLVNQTIARHLLPGLLRRLLEEFKVELRGCPKTVSLMGIMEMTGHKGIQNALDADWGQKFEAPILAIKVVKDLDEALQHIAQFRPGHTDTIVTRNYQAAMRFVQEVDSSAVLVNASTRLNSGDQFGLGTEIGTNTTRFHTRGPLTMQTLTCEKYVCLGTGQLRYPHPVPEAYQDAMMLSFKF